jgi:biopolymer transport protein TolQ
VLAILLIFSLTCWYIIGYKWLYLRRAFAENESFLEGLRGDPAAQRRRRGRERSARAAPSPQMYRAGYDELLRVKAASRSTTRPGGHRKHRARPAPRHVEADHRAREHGALPRHHRQHGALHRALRHGVRHHARLLQLTASQGTSTIDRVGPGIAEALFTTAVGLVAAIPAVIGYNYFIRQIRVISNEMDVFGNDFLNIVRRHILK